MSSESAESTSPGAKEKRGTAEDTLKKLQAVCVCALRAAAID